MNMTKIGDWLKVGRLIWNLKKEMNRAGHQSLVNFGLKAEAIAVGHISAQDLPWKKLKSATVARKVRKGYSENILVESSTYFQSITSWVDGNGVNVGVKRDVTEADGTIVADLAALHEFGSRDGTIPARKLWEPTMEEAIQWHVKNNRPSSILMRNIQSYLR